MKIKLIGKGYKYVSLNGNLSDFTWHRVSLRASSSGMLDADDCIRMMRI